METVEGRFERTDEIELPRSTTENSLFAACICIAYNAVIKEKQIIDHNVEGGCSKLKKKKLVFTVRPVGSSLKCLGIADTKLTSRFAVARGDTAKRESDGCRQSTVLHSDLKYAGCVSATWYC
jgi:hypothetical protein